MNAEHFIHYSKRVAERLIIIQRSIIDGIDISEEDRQILRSVFEWYETDMFDWLNIKEKPKQVVTQQGLFSDKKSE